MSSAKDYLLEIVTNSNHNSVLFRVTNKKLVFVRHLRLPLVALLLAYIIPQCKQPFHQLWSGKVDWHSHISAFKERVLYGSLNELLDVSAAGVLLAGAIVSVMLLVSLQQASDSLMVIEDMGVQISSTSQWRFLNFGKNGKFIPILDIIDIVIHEGFQTYGQVIFYMCVLTRDKGRGSAEGNGVQVIFPKFLPRKEILLQVWKLSRQMLYGTNRRHYRHVPGQGLREVQHLH